MQLRERFLAKFLPKVLLAMAPVPSLRWREGGRASILNNLEDCLRDTI